MNSFLSRLKPGSNSKVLLRAACSVLTGLLLYLSFPPVDLWWLSFAALVPLLMVLSATSSMLRCFFYAGIAGAAFYVPALLWLASVTVGGWLLLAGYLALYFCLFGAVFYLTARRFPVGYVFLLPFVWVGLEFIKSTAFTGFPWFIYGHTQYRFQLMLQLASLFGAYGVSFILVFFNIALAQLLRVLWTWKKHGRDAVVFPLLHGVYLPALSALLMITAIMFGHYSSRDLTMEEGPVFGVVQQNMPPALAPEDIQRIYRLTEGDIAALTAAEREELSERLQEYAKQSHLRAVEEIDTAARLSRELAGAGPALIAWPETTVEVPLNPEASNVLTVSERWRRDYALDTIESLAGEMDCYLLVGSTYFKGGETGRWGGSANSAYLFSPEGRIIGHYNKKRLVPFGEYTPGREWLPAPLAALLESFAIAQSVPGEDKVVFAEPVKFSAPICYDNVFSPLLRSFRRRGAQVMVNISNEGWYHIRGELEQHLALAVFRAVETRTTVARATNTGISCFIDPLGEVYGTVSREYNGREKKKNVEGSLAKPVRLTSKVPLYVYWGDWFAVICVLFTVGTVAWCSLSLSKGGKQKMERRPRS